MSVDCRVFKSHNVTIQFQTDDVTLLSKAEQVMPPGAHVSELGTIDRTYVIVRNDDDTLSLAVDDGPVSRHVTLNRMLDYLEGDIQIFVAEFATPHLFVHAGVVAVDGRAIIIPGRSFAGKSTLVTSLVKAGATYYSDEYAVLDRQGRVIPYPRRVSLRTGPHGPAGRLDFAHLAPQGPAEDHAIPIGLVALLRYDEEAGWDVRELDQLEAIMAMSEQTVAIQRRPADSFAILGEVARGAPVIQGTRGDVEDTMQRLQDIVHRQHL